MSIYIYIISTNIQDTRNYRYTHIYILIHIIYPYTYIHIFMHMGVYIYTYVYIKVISFSRCTNYDNCYCVLVQIYTAVHKLAHKLAHTNHILVAKKSLDRNCSQYPIYIDTYIHIYTCIHVDIIYGHMYSTTQRTTSGYTYIYIIYVSIYIYLCYSITRPFPIEHPGCCTPPPHQIKQKQNFN